MPPQEIEFSLVGPAIKFPYPLDDLLTAQREFAAVLDASYSVLAHKPRLTRLDRIDYQILAGQPREGSYLQQLFLHVPEAQALLFAGGVAVNQLSAGQVWESAKAAYEFLKLVFNARERGAVPKVSQTVEGDTIIALPGSDVKITNNVFQIANRAEPHFKRLSERIEPSRIEKIEASDPTGGSITITEHERRLFLGGSSQVGRETEVVARIFDFNTEIRGGRLRVGSEEELPARDYSFEVQGNQNILPYIIALTRDSVRLRCIPEYLVKTTVVQLIRKLWILQIIDDGVPKLSPLFVQ